MGVFHKDLLGADLHFPMGRSPTALGLAAATADAYLIEDASGNDLFLINTASGSINFGNATTNPAFNTLGTGLATFGGNLFVQGRVAAINTDAASGTPENPFIQLAGGDGSEVVATQLWSQSDLDRLYCYQQATSVVDGESDRTSQLVIGPPSQFSGTGVNADAILRLRGHVPTQAVGTFVEAFMHLDADASQLLLIAPAAFDLVVTARAWSVGGGFGSAGDVLTSNGASAAPTWQSSAMVMTGWTDDGAIVRLTTAGDTVAIGAAAMSGTEKLRVVGAGLFEGNLTLSAGATRVFSIATQANETNGNALSIKGGAGGPSAGVAAGGNGGPTTQRGGDGGPGVGAFGGGNGATSSVTGGNGGAGTAVAVSGNGGSALLAGGSPAGSSGGGQGVAGHAYMRGGSTPDNTNLGKCIIGDANTSAIELANTTQNSTITQFGSGQVTWSGNVDATAGLDVSTAALTASAGLTLTSVGLTMTGLDIGSGAARMDQLFGQQIDLANSVSPIVVAQSAASSGSPALATITGAAHLTLAASTECIDIDFALNQTKEFSTGALATQRAIVARAPTYAFVGASTITNAATVAITGAPVAGTNATITNSYALWVQAGIARFDGGLDSPGSGTDTFRAGRGALASNTGSIAIGRSASTTGLYSVAVGYTASDGGFDSAVALGTFASLQGASGIAIGRNTVAAGTGTLIGYHASNDLMCGASAVGVGYLVNAIGNSAVAVGGSALATATASITVGAGSTANSGASSIGIGYGINVTHADCVAIGREATTTATKQVVIGSGNYYVQDVWVGQGVNGLSGASTSVAFRNSNSVGTNVAGGHLRLYPGTATGNAASGNLEVYGSTAGASGTTLQTNQRRLLVDGGNGDLTTNELENGQNLQIKTKTELHTLAAAVNSDTTITVPAGTIVLFVSARVTTTITGPAAWRYGLSTDATPNRYGSALALAAGTTNKGVDNTAAPDAVLYNSDAAVAIRLQANDGLTAFTAGVVRVTIHYIDVTVPSS